MYCASPDAELTYAEFLCVVNAIITKFDTMEYNNEFFPIKCDKTVYTTCFFFAAHLMGKTYVPIPSDIPPNREHYIQSTLGVEQIIVEDDFLASMDLCFEKVNLKDIYRNLKSQYKNLPSYNEDKLAYVLFTSGSTGNPKGVKISFKNLYSFVEWTTAEYELSEKDVFLNQVPFTFDLSVLDIYSSFINKSKIILCNKKTSNDVKKIISLIERYEANIIYSTPSLLRLLSFSKKFQLDAAPLLRKILFCGEPLSVKLAQKFYEICSGAKLYNLYGPTETNVVTSVCIDETVLNSDELTIGMAMSDYELHVLDESLNPVPDGEVGQLAVSGSSVSLGYLNDLNKTNKAFQSLPFGSGERCYLTGDLVVKKEKNFFYRGRMDHQFKFMGYRIEAGDIEACILSDESVNGCVVLPMLDAMSTVSGILAAIEVKDGNFSLETLQSTISKELPKYMVPTRYVVMDSLPITEHGKVDRKKLLAGV